MKLNRKERAQTLLAMDYLAGCINDEEIFDKWLMVGIPDGEIDYNSSYEEIISQLEDDDYYMDDVVFSELMSVFLAVMVKAIKSGGLYCNGVVSK